MNTQQRAVVQQALKAFEVATTHTAADRQEVLAAITALRQLLEQPEQADEPIGYFTVNDYDRWEETGTSQYGKPLYERPQKADEPDGDELTIAYMSGLYDGKKKAKREWVRLTANDLAEIPPSAYEGAIWADAKLKEKNAP